MKMDIFFFKDKKSEEWKRLRVGYDKRGMYVADISEPILDKWQVESAMSGKSNREVWRFVVEHYGKPLDLYVLKNNEMQEVGRIV